MANRRREPVGYRPFKADPVLSEGLLAVSRPGGDLLNRVASGLFRLADEADVFADRNALAAGHRAGEQAALGSAPDIGVGTTAAAPGSPAAAPGTGGDHHQIAASILRKEEGFRDTPYFDVTAYRTGFGSDTITKADGSVVKVEKGVKITRADAERDLARRIPEFENTAAGQVGGENWNRLPANVRAGLISVAYNFGSLPKSVVAAARGGDVGKIAGAVGGLGTNKARRGREASIIRGAGVPVGDPSFQVSGAAPTLTGRNTIFGRAFDDAASKTYLRLLNTEVLSTTSQLFNKFGDDPAQLEKAFGALKGELKNDHVFDEIAADFEVSYGQLSTRYLDQSRQRQAKRIEAEQKADFMARTNALSTDIAQKIIASDPSDPSAGDLLIQSQKQLEDHYDAAVDIGILTPQAAEKAKTAARGNTTVSFYTAQTKEKTADEIATMRTEMEEDFGAGNLEGVDAPAWARLDAELRRAETLRRQQEAKATADLADRAQKQIARVEAGFEPDAAELSQIKLDQDGSPEGSGIVDVSDRMIDAAKSLRDLPLPEAREFLEKLRADTGKNASDQDIAVLAYAEKRLADIEALAAKDPVGYEIATGRLELTPLALDGGADELAASLASRRNEMVPIAAQTGRPLEIFRPAERNAIARLMIENPDQMPGLVKALRVGLGADAAAALGEISKEAPALAHAAGVSIATGSDAFVEEIAGALSAKAKGEFKLKMPKSEKFAEAAGPGFARALGYLGQTRSAALQTAQLIYEREANMLGFDPDEIGKPDTPAAAAWSRALNRALGADFIGGRQTGGLGEANGSPIIVPAGMDTDEPQRLISGLTDTQLARLAPIRTANGVPVSAGQIRDGNLVTAGDGVYYVALGDPQGFEPRFVLGNDGGFWKLDLRHLSAVASDRQDSGGGF